MTDLRLPPIIGHRGAARHAPENTLAGIRMAASQGATWVEVDVKLTADRIPILMHDDTLDRTTDGRGPVAALTLEQVRRLDAGRWFGPAFAGERVPTLAEVLALVRDLGMGINLEIKPCPGRAEETAGVALTTARSLWPDGVPPPLVSSFDYDSLAMARLVAPDWPIGYLIDRRRPDWATQAAAVGAATIHVNARREDADSIAVYRATGRPVLAYTVNSLAAAREVLSWGVTGVFTDTPATLAPLVG
ncbi:MAG: hypothetical protein RLY86_3913 [Pseudomonadota bacterium]|jgi:glycerophosphoryl diester phosphodiesterase